MIESGTMYCSYDGSMCMSPSVYIGVLDKTCKDLSLICFLAGLCLGVIIGAFVFRLGQLKEKGN